MNIQTLLRQLFRRKSLQDLDSDEGHGPKLNRVLTARDVFCFGVAAIIGTGIFVLPGTVAAHLAGPATMISFLVAGIICAPVACAYAEVGSMIPKAGSAYTYAYTTLGELVAWIIGWDLILEYGFGASTVAVGWSDYLINVLHGVGINLPVYLCQAPSSLPWLEVRQFAELLALSLLLLGFAYNNLRKNLSALVECFLTRDFKNSLWELIYWLALIFGAFALGAAFDKLLEIIPHITSIDLPAILIIALLSGTLLLGVKHSARMTGALVVVKLVVLAIFICLGITHIHTINYVPFVPFGWGKVFTGSGILFFAFIGFDSITTQAEECKNPQQDLPKGILGSLSLCTVLYVVVTAIMTGAVSYKLLGGGSSEGAPMALVLRLIGYPGVSVIVSVGAIAGLTSVLMVLLSGQSRILMRMSKDGLLPAVFGSIHPKFLTPTRSIIILGALVVLLSGLLPISELAEMTNIGTLWAFVLVSIGVVILRKIEPKRARKFRCPGSPFIPLAGAAGCFWLMCTLQPATWIRFVVWLVIGLVVYFTYAYKHSLART